MLLLLFGNQGAAPAAAVPGTALLRFLPAHGALIRFLPVPKEES